MKAIQLFDLDDREMTRVLREVNVLKSEDMTRNGKKRIFVWSDDDECNYMLYPDQGTAYPEFDNLIQKQRIGERFLYKTVS